MFGTDQKVLLISAGYPDYEGDPAPVAVKEINCASDLVKEFANMLAWDCVAMQALVANANFVQGLDRIGFREVAKLEDVASKIAASTRYYINTDYSMGITEVDLTSLSPNEIEFLASDRGAIFQLVDKNCLAEVNPEAHKKILSCRKKAKKDEKDKLARSKERSEKKKNQKLEAAAKKLLAANGIDVV